MSTFDLYHRLVAQEIDNLGAGRRGPRKQSAVADKGNLCRGGTEEDTSNGIWRRQ